MATPEQIKSSIGEFEVNANRLRNNARSLVATLREVTHSKIIPQVEEILPEHYSIHREEVKIFLHRDYKDEVPTEICLDLTMWYKGLPIDTTDIRSEFYDDCSDRGGNLIYDKVREVQKDQRIKELAEKYGFKAIHLRTDDPLDQ